MPDIPFRTRCTDCKFYDSKCLLDVNSRMIKKRCYIDTVAKKLKIKQQTVVARCNSVLGKIGMDSFSFIPKAKEEGWFNKEEWAILSNTQRMQEINYMLYYLSNWLKDAQYKSDDTFTDADLPTFAEIKVVVAILNCYFSTWRDEEYIHCAKCGELIKNSRQKNRKYCDKCKDKHKTFYEDKIKICIDCGCKFEAWHNREVRCIDCQINANKAAARERVRRCRERKRNGLESKS
ncbi:MAG: hypothetical protein ACI4HM_07600 [Ruminococcus sp.]